MKITKRQLRRIIREEKARLTESQVDWKPLSRDHAEQLGEPKISALHGSGRNNNVMSQLHTAIDALINAMGNEEAHQELLGIVEDWDMEAMDEVFTDKYDTDSALKGKQKSGLSDELQKSIIDKSIADQEDDPEEKKDEGISLDKMSDSWRQILGNCLGADK